MTAATKAKAKVNPGVELGQLEEAAVKAAAEVQRLKSTQQSAVDQINALRAERLTLQFECPEQFSDTGAKVGTDAAKLTTAMERAAGSLDRADFESAIKAAEMRTDAAAERVVRHRGEHARQLLLDLVKEDEEASRQWAQWAAGASEALGRKLEVQHRATSICTTTGAYDPRDFHSLDPYAALVTQVSAAVEIRPALPRQLLRELEDEQGE